MAAILQNFNGYFYDSQPILRAPNMTQIVLLNRLTTVWSPSLHYLREWIEVFKIGFIGGMRENTLKMGVGFIRGMFLNMGGDYMC